MPCRSCSGGLIIIGDPSASPRQQQFPSKLDVTMIVAKSNTFLLFLLLFLPQHKEISGSCESNSTDQLSRLENKCFDTTHIPGWWSYIWCFRDNITQVHYDESRQVIETNNLIGSYVLDESRLLEHVYRRNTSECQSTLGSSIKRQANVVISCCRDDKWSAMHDRFRAIAELATFVESVTEPTQCTYLLKVCSDLVCPPNNPIECASSFLFRGDNDKISDESKNSHSFELAGPDFLDFLADQVVHVHLHDDVKISSSSSAYMTKGMQAAHLNRVREMFYHGYDMYMLHAQPEVSRPGMSSGSR